MLKKTGNILLVKDIYLFVPLSVRTYVCLPTWKSGIPKERRGLNYNFGIFTQIETYLGICKSGKIHLLQSAITFMIIACSD